MFITRKKYKEAIAQAVAEAENRIHERHWQDERIREAHERISELERRIYSLENPDRQVEGFCRSCNVPLPAPVTAPRK